MVQLGITFLYEFRCVCVLFHTIRSFTGPTTCSLSGIPHDTCTGHSNCALAMNPVRSGNRIFVLDVDIGCVSNRPMSGDEDTHPGIGCIVLSRTLSDGHVLLCNRYHVARSRRSAHYMMQYCSSSRWTMAVDSLV